jgi:hypothetical protein
MTIEHAKVLIFDRGDHTYLAETFAAKAEKVWHYTPILGRQPKNKEDLIGSGMDGVEKIDDFEQYKDKADLIIFPGEFDGEICDRMRKEGKRVFGSGLSSDLEIDKILFLKTLKQVGLPVIKTVIVKGLDAAEKHLADKEDKWIKLPWCRGDFDTIHFHSMKTFQPWLDYQRLHLGEGGADKIKLLIQDSFPCVVESGGDRYCIDGEFTPTGTIGYENKDKSYVYRIVKQLPKILDGIDKKMSPEFKARGYRGAYSTEARINKKGEVRFTDLTARLGSPPGEGICESYTTFAQDVFDVADGKIPEMKYENEYGAMIVLVSSWNEKNEICVDFPKEIQGNVKLRHSYKHNGNYYCTPNESSGYFGAVVSQGKTLKEAVDKVNDMADQVKTLELEFDHIHMSEVEKMITDGKQFGIEM